MVVPGSQGGLHCRTKFSTAQCILTVQKADRGRWAAGRGGLPSRRTVEGLRVGLVLPGTWRGPSSSELESMHVAEPRSRRPKPRVAGR